MGGYLQVLVVIANGVYHYTEGILKEGTSRLVQ